MNLTTMDKKIIANALWEHNVQHVNTAARYAVDLERIKSPTQEQRARADSVVKGCLAAAEKCRDLSRQFSDEAKREFARDAALV